MKHFFHFCGGTDRSLILQCSNWEQSRHSMIGLFVFLTGLLAFVSSSFALSSVFPDNPLYSFGAGIIWGILIFSLDRFIVSSLNETGLKQFLLALPRIALALLISLVIARPLELRIFQEEILGAIASEQQERITAAQRRYSEQLQELKTAQDAEISTYLKSVGLTQVQVRISGLEADRSRCSQEVRELRASFKGEMDGTSGTERQGYGKISKKKETLFMGRQKECLALKNEIETLDEQRKSLQEDSTDALSKIQTKYENQSDNLKELSANEMVKLNEYPDSFLKQHKTLSQLQRDDLSVNIAAWLVTAIFILIECSPVLTKLLSSAGNYEHLLRSDREVESQRITVDRDYRLQMIRMAKEGQMQKGTETINKWKEDLFDSRDLVIALNRRTKSVIANSFVNRSPESGVILPKTQPSVEDSRTARWHPNFDALNSTRTRTILVGTLLVAGAFACTHYWYDRFDFSITAAGFIIALITFIKTNWPGFRG